MAWANPVKLSAYVGTGIKDPVNELCDRYQQLTGVKIEMTFNNSGSLVGQLKLSKTGDIFMPGASDFVDQARQAGLIDQVSKTIAYHVPIIIVPRANPTRIASIRDLGRPGVKLIVPDMKATALGKSIRIVFERLGMVQDLERNVIAAMESPQKVVAALRLGQGDAGITNTAAMSGSADQFTIIEIDPAINVVEAMPCAVISTSASLDEARKFMAFIEREGPAVFLKYGFRTSQ